MEEQPGPLILGGGDSEGSEGMRLLAEEVKTRGGKLVICSVPPADLRQSGRACELFLCDLGLRRVEILELHIREQARAQEALSALDGAGGVLFVSEDPVRLVATLAGSPLLRRIRELHAAGAVVAGTSSGASALPRRMFCSGRDELGPRRTQIGVGRGLGLVGGLILDPHFAEWGRIGRLLTSVGQHAEDLCLGIARDTAIRIGPSGFGVVGRGTVYVIDGSPLPGSSTAALSRSQAGSLYGLRLHLLSEGDHFDISERRPQSNQDLPT